MRCSKAELLSVKDSAFWMDVLDELEVCIEEAEEALLELPEQAVMEKMDTSTLLLRTGALSGMIKVYKFIAEDLIDSLATESRVEQILSQESKEEIE